MKNSLIKFSENIKADYFDELHWFKDGIHILNEHVKNGKKVIVVTAAPEKLASVLVASIGIQAKVIGTPLKRKIGGWVGGKHCRHDEKLRRLKLCGVKGPWYATYSDDIEDDFRACK
ncbi:HAD family hydrolase [Acinetobacter larvae]|uniref:Uncharacterized protein n=1 Tax=Acinetobacter larvae TaxID=1789224 RepID=A0A1B2M096_9GAMM|nr:HAD family hydrolase [Acinetobacter larvae]AOA58589.1 hypothetical protein BFG52_09645 [Acinetobacter larvae]